MKCSLCRAEISIETEPIISAGELVGSDGAPHRLECAGNKHLQRITIDAGENKTAAPCPKCNHPVHVVNWDRRGILRRCANQDCRRWTYQVLVFRGRGRNLQPQLAPDRDGP